MPANRQRLAELALAGNTLIWGATFVIVKSTLAGISPLLFLALRFLLAAAALALLFARALLQRPPSPLCAIAAERLNTYIFH